MGDYYDVIGVPRTASSGEIRQAYVKLAKENHPDRFTDPVEKARADEFFKELTAAYNTLSNDARRKDYDAEMMKPKLTSPEDIAREAYANGMQACENLNFELAVEFFRTAAHHQPNDASYLSALGRTLGRSPRAAREAIEVLEKAIQLEPQNGSFHADLARIFNAQGLKLRARRSIEAAQRLLPGDRAIQKLAAEIARP
jgi:curved DNA-binding protein CbpA